MTNSDTGRSEHAVESGSYKAFSNVRCYLPWMATLILFGWGAPAPHLLYYLATFAVIVAMLSVPLKVCQPDKSKAVSFLRIYLLLIIIFLVLNIVILFDGDFCRLWSGVAIYKYAGVSNTAYLELRNIGSPRAIAVADIAFIESAAILLVPFAYYVLSGLRGMFGLQGAIFPTLEHHYRWWRYVFIFSAIASFAINHPPDYTGHSGGRYGPMFNFALNPLALAFYLLLLSLLSISLFALDRTALFVAYSSRKSIK